MSSLGNVHKLCPFLGGEALKNQTLEGKNQTLREEGGGSKMTPINRTSFMDVPLDKTWFV